MKRDTPRDVPAVALSATDSRGLPRVPGLETLESLYQSWAELQRQNALAQQAQASERARLEQQGSFVVGAVKAASAQPASFHARDTDAVAPADDGLSRFLQDAERRLAENRQVLEARFADESAAFGHRLTALKRALVDRASRHLAAVRPRLTLMVRRVDAARSVLHLARVQLDESVLLLLILTGKIPSRHQFLFDESTEDTRFDSAALYPEEGVASTEIRPSASELEQRLRAFSEVLPVKGFLPAWVPRPDGDVDFFRCLQRGPVMEVEIRDADLFRNLLTREEAERFAGYLLRLNLDQKIELQIQSD